MVVEVVCAFSVETRGEDADRYPRRTRTKGGREREEVYLQVGVGVGFATFVPTASRLLRRSENG